MKYETTYSSFIHEGSSHVRIMTKVVPFETNSLEIDKKNSDEKDGLKEVDEHVENEAKEKSKVNMEQGLVKNDVQSSNMDGEQLPAEMNDKKKEGIMSALDNSHDKVHIPAEKGDLGLIEDMVETSEGDKIDQNAAVGQRKHTHATIDSHKIDGRMDSLSEQKDDKEKPVHQGPKNVICNSAGCFSSLEELDMFNHLSLQVRSKLEDVDRYESSIKDHSTSTDESQENDNDANNSEHNGNESKLR